jgi:iron complex outermembrane recepter protein
VRGFYFGNEPPNFPNTLYIRQGDPRQIGVTVDMRF